MKKMFCLLSVCFLCIRVCSQEITVKGKITDTDSMMVMFGNIDHVDTVYTSNGAFSFKRKLSSPEIFSIACIKNKQSIDAIREGNERKMRSKEDITSREMFLENGEVVIKSSFADLGSTKIARANHFIQDIYDEFKKRFNPLVKMARTIIDSSYAPNRNEPEKKVFTMLYKRIEQIENEVAEKFVTENTNNAAGAYVLYRYCRIENHHKLDSLYQLFNPALQSTSYLKNIKNKIKALAALKPGENVPDFAAITIDAKTIRLSNMNGKYIVLDFWGSWCMPCISGFPKMKEYYTKYADKIEFIGIACNDKDTEWKDAINKYDLTWLQILNTKGTNDLAVKYNVEAYPTKILIDRNGKFIQAFTGEGADFYQKLDAILQTNSK